MKKKIIVKNYLIFFSFHILFFLKPKHSSQFASFSSSTTLYDPIEPTPLSLLAVYRNRVVQSVQRHQLTFFRLCFPFQIFKHCTRRRAFISVELTSLSLLLHLTSTAVDNVGATAPRTAFQPNSKIANATLFVFWSPLFS